MTDNSKPDGPPKLVTVTISRDDLDHMILHDMHVAEAGRMHESALRDLSEGALGLIAIIGCIALTVWRMIDWVPVIATVPTGRVVIVNLISLLSRINGGE